jgi:hypothetical protein
MGKGDYFLGVSSQGMKLTTHLHLVLKLRLAELHLHSPPPSLQHNYELHKHRDFIVTLKKELNIFNYVSHTYDKEIYLDI